MNVNIEPAICNSHLPFLWDCVGERGGWGVERREWEGGGGGRPVKQNVQGRGDL